jgi:hypothetical protein
MTSKADSRKYDTGLDVSAHLQAVTSFVIELSMHFPMIALEEDSLQLAVGRAGPLQAIGMGSASSRSSGEPIAIYDLTNGRKKRVLHFRLTTPPTSRHPPLSSIFKGQIACASSPPQDSVCWPRRSAFTTNLRAAQLYAI